MQRQRAGHFSCEGRSAGPFIERREASWPLPTPAPTVRCRQAPACSSARCCKAPASSGARYAWPLLARARALRGPCLLARAAAWHLLSRALICLAPARARATYPLLAHVRWEVSWPQPARTDCQRLSALCAAARALPARARVAARPLLARARALLRGPFLLAGAAAWHLVSRALRSPCSPASAKRG